VSDTTNGQNHGSDGRFEPGNVAARRHGLRSASRAELRKRDRRTSRLLKAFLSYRADEGRPLGPTQLILARRYAETEVMARDLFAAWLLRPSDAGYHQRFISTTRAQVLLASALGETVASMAVFKSTAGSNGQSLASRLARLQLEPPGDDEDEETG